MISLQHANALQRLADHLFEGAKALDVGSGSGYLTVAMAIMVSERGREGRPTSTRIDLIMKLSVVRRHHPISFSRMKCGVEEWEVRRVLF